MIKEIFGKKIGMTQIFSPEGELLPVTLVEIEPACILEKVSYPNKERAKIGCFKIKDTKIPKVKKPQKGYFEKIGVPPYKLVREVEIEEKPKSTEAKAEKKEVHQPENSNGEEKKGQSQKESLQENKDDSRKEQDTTVKKEPGEGEAKEVKKEEKSPDKGQAENDKKVSSRYVGIEIFSQGQLVTVRSKTKGKGFAGAIKRHNMQRQPSSHGSGMHRRVGSVGASATPSKIAKNKKMPGHLGSNYRVTKNLKILKVDKERKVIFVRGSIGGSNGAVVRVTKQN
ncbi:MAG: 50S ribosomal protein L3 [Candidatus Omnitrophica bacterium]|nr:50S ribosomal protein L3 [Candidatus Omnitrophota bacterium]MCF7893492.1 50S ribosomal protein L3 [Candidatus Omnitrophota bacterium]